MNRRQNNLLLEIADNNSGKPITVQGFAHECGVSEQTVRNDIREINDLLEKRGLMPIDIDAGGGILAKANSLLVIEDVDLYTYKLSPSERQTVLAVLLMANDGYTTIATLSERVVVSRNTLISDLDDLKLWFDENGLSLLSQPRKGLKVIGSENNIRRGLLKLLMLNDYIHESSDRRNNNIFHTLLIQSVDEGGILDEVRPILKDCESAHRIYLADFSFHEMCYFMMVVVGRMQNGNYVEESTDAEWQDARRSSRYKMAEDILNRVCERFGLQPRLGELVYIINQLRMESYIKHPSSKQNTDMIDIQILIHEFIYRLSKAFDIHYYLNFYLYDMLFTHMKTLAYRMKQNHMLSSPLLEQMEGEYDELFQEVAKHLHPLEEYLDVRITKDEIAFVVMYLLAILEKNKVTDISINTLLVCNTGLGSAQLILAKTSTIFKQLNVLEVTSSHRVMEMDTSNVELILSTVPLDEPPVPYVQISPLLGDRDINAIQSAILSIQAEKRVSEPPVVQQQSSGIDKSILNEGESLSALLHEEMIGLDVQAADWRTAVRRAGEMLCATGCTAGGYTESMIRNIEQNGPYVVIYPGIAIPHAERADGAIRPGASFVRLEQPVNFGHKENDPVEFIIAFSVIDAASIGRALYNLTRMLALDGFIDGLKTASNPAAIMQNINEFEIFIDINGG